MDVAPPPSCRNTNPLFFPGTRTIKPKFIRALRWIFTCCDHDKDGTLSDLEMNDFHDLKLFNFALNAVLHPPAPLYFPETMTLKPRCVKALKSIFIRSDHDKDGALSDAEWNALQVKCFNRRVQRNLSEGVNRTGLTLTGFLKLHELRLKDRRLEYTWSMLRKHGYGGDLKLRDDYIPASFKREPDQTVELTNEAVEFLKNIFRSFDLDEDGALQPADLEDLFSPAPESPWERAPYKDAAVETALGGLYLDGFLSKWSLMTLLEPAKSLANLIYIGYPAETTSAFRITRQRQVDRKEQQSERNVFQCFVFGPKRAGKSAFLTSFLGREISESYVSTPEECFAANVVIDSEGTKKTLVLREIPEDGFKLLMSNKDSLADCDVAIFVHDSSDLTLWNRASEMLFDVAQHGENSGFEVPCLIVAAKTDIQLPSALEPEDSLWVPISEGLEAPILVSMMLGYGRDVFHRIIDAAKSPHLSIPETEAGRSRKKYTQIFKQSLIIGSAVGAALLAYSQCTAGDSTSC
ncbi:hypothetical protein AQUCO_01300106v1 [Aquilegia coerulea]|uniref:EF-hand domain-containing protein n=1 Tax=Aquilegia coerulea TaxID=218851 RepID=A0A2G5DZZ2_AQUCA|nr:hypothetical protein AQUCO_01300106v1 [Aquilegia coerulea]